MRHRSRLSSASSRSESHALGLRFDREREPWSRVVDHPVRMNAELGPASRASGIVAGRSAAEVSWWLCCVVESGAASEGMRMKRRRRDTVLVELPSAFAGFRFPPEVIVLGSVALFDRVAR